jgi:hypothetical protein
MFKAGRFVTDYAFDYAGLQSRRRAADSRGEPNSLYSVHSEKTGDNNYDDNHADDIKDVHGLAPYVYLHA